MICRETVSARDLELELWQLVARHPDARVVAETWWPRLAERLPTRDLTLWHIDADHRRAEPIVSLTRAGRADDRPCLPLSVDALRALTDWCETGAPAQIRGGPGGPITPLLAADQGPLVALPLGGRGGARGALLLGGRHDRLEGKDANLLRQIVEPFAVALTNHTRIQTLTRTTAAPIRATPTVAYQSLEAVNADHIAQVLQRCHGRVDGPFGAAVALEINPNTLRSRMRKLGISARSHRLRPTGAVGL